MRECPLKNGWMYCVRSEKRGMDETEISIYIRFGRVLEMLEERWFRILRDLNGPVQKIVDACALKMFPKMTDCIEREIPLACSLSRRFADVFMQRLVLGKPIHSFSHTQFLQRLFSYL